MEKMYKGIANSPESFIKEKLIADGTILYIADNSILPEIPNLLVIGEGERAETVLVKSKRDDNGLNIQRAIEGNAIEWDKGTTVARNFCNLDYQTLIDNIGELDNNKADRSEIKTKLAEMTDDSSHRLVSDAEKAIWNNKAEKAEIKTKLSELIDDSTHRLVTDTEKTAWNKVSNKADITSVANLEQSKADKTDLEKIEKKIEGISPYKYIKLEINCGKGTKIKITKDSQTIRQITADTDIITTDLDEYGKYKIEWNNSENTGHTTMNITEAKIHSFEILDKTNAPGEKMLKVGTMEQGYFGVVTNGLPSGTELASKCGITAGTAQYSNEGYLKFAYKGKILFKSKKPFRHSISWDDINNKDCVFGKTIEHNGVKYKVRLMQGHDPNRIEKNSDGYYKDAGRNCYHSEWNMLMLPIHEQAKDYSWKWKDDVYNSEIPQDWGVNFTDQDLLTSSNYGSGSYQWCQETVYGSSHRLSRGGYGVSTAYSFVSPYSSSGQGWSPVLEVIE